MEMRNTLRELKKSLDDKERATKTTIAATVLHTAQSIIESKVGCKVLVEVLEACSNTKALDQALKKIRTISPTTSALLISVDHDAKKIFALSSVPQVRSFSLEHSDRSKNSHINIENSFIVCGK